MLGLAVTFHGAVRFNQPDDLTLWEKRAIEGTGVSMLMPPDWTTIEPTQVSGKIVKGMVGYGTRIIVMLAEVEEEDESESREYKAEIISQNTYTKNGIEYTESVRKIRQTEGVLLLYVTAIEIHVNGKRYVTSITSGYIDSSLKKEIQNILHTLEVE